jgi:folylpolyglutamate synthase/dihydrofolate synthase
MAKFATISDCLRRLRIIRSLMVSTSTSNSCYIFNFMRTLHALSPHNLKHHDRQRVAKPAEAKPTRDRRLIPNTKSLQVRPSRLKVRYLFSAYFRCLPVLRMGIDLSLDRIKILLARLPTYDRPTVHIAGTNGKGSVSAIVSSILSTAKLSVGRFNSPHLAYVRDCICINGAAITEADYDSARDVVVHANEECGSAVSSFELLTCTALYAFQRAQVNVVVLEVGLGGRLDATNAIPDVCILVSALTSVDLDHQAFLGDTVSKIATEKVHIARKGRPFVLGPQTHAEAAETARSVVESLGGEVIPASAALARRWTDKLERPRPSGDGIEPPAQPVEVIMACFAFSTITVLPLHGDHQLVNLGVAAAIISTLLTHPICTSLLPLQEILTPRIVADGIKSTRWPGRLSFHRLPLNVLFPNVARQDELTLLADGAHNAASAATLAAFLSQLSAGRQIHVAFVLGLSHSPPKTPMETLSPLFCFKPGPYVSLSVAVLGFSPVEGMPWVKPVSPSDLRDVVETLLPDVAIWSAQDTEKLHLDEALRWSADEMAKGSGGGLGLVVLAGSLYLVADFYRMLGRSDVA